MDLKWFQQQLRHQLAELTALEDTAANAADIVELDQTSVGRLSRMDALQGQAMAKASQMRREQEIRAISLAMSRLESGDFGYCVECDEPIASARLQHNPSVATCLDCAARAES